MNFIGISRTNVGPFRRRNVAGVGLSALLILSLMGTVCFILTRPVHADDLFFTNVRAFGSLDVNSESTAVGDLDGDGDLDVVAGNAKQDDEKMKQFVIYANDGRGTLTKRSVLAPGDGRIGSVAVADLNNDGRLDIIGGDLIYLSDEHHDFGAGYPFTTSNRGIRSITVGDVDGDGDFDIVVGRLGYPNTVHINDGNAQFPTSHLLAAGAAKTQKVALGDLDGDGDLDIAVGNLAEPNVIYFNDGSGDFSNPHTIGPGNDSTRDLSIADIDGDTDLDIIVINGYNSLNHKTDQSMIYLNTGPGHFYSGEVTCSTPGLLCLETQQVGSGTGVVTGDVDNDGDVDVITCLGGNLVYLNEGPAGFSKHIFGSGIVSCTDIVSGDLDGNGQLDVVTSNSFQQVIYFNSKLNKRLTAHHFGAGSEYISSTLLGDVNGDSYLDLITNSAVAQGKRMIYLNDGRGQFASGTATCESTATVRCFGIGTNAMYQIVPADLDGDRDLDLVAGGTQQAIAYFNDGTGNFLNSRAINEIDKDNWLSGSVEIPVVGDLDGDSDLDVVLGTHPQALAYFNDGAGNFPEKRPIAHILGSRSAAGDLDNDGDLDLAVGDTSHSQLIIYFNDGAGNFPMSAPIPDIVNGTRTPIIGDFDNDGDLDLATDNLGQKFLLINDGTGRFPTRRTIGTTTYGTNNLAAGDVDGNGSLDIVAATGRRSNDPSCCMEQSVVYFNDGSGYFSSAYSFGDPTETLTVAIGDLNNDGALDIVAGRSKKQSAVYLNTAHNPKGLMSNPPYVVIRQPGSTQKANFYSTTEVFTNTIIPITYTLLDQESDLADIRAFYSLDGGGQWHPAIAATGTLTKTLETSPSGKEYTYYWDTFKSGLFGTFQNVVFRIETYPDLHPKRSRTAGPYQWSSRGSQTFPFRVRGTQVQVMHGTKPAPGAMVYQLRPGRTTAGKAIGPAGGAPFRTDPLGNLQGHGEIGPGDHLFAVAPITVTDQYTLYYTNGIPHDDGLATYTVDHPGLQQLIVSPDHPLLLFNLHVSLEWDAHNDPTFLQKVQTDLALASRHLYDFTDGQVALGNVTLHQNADYWAYSDVVIHTTNNFRPYAAQGGVVVTPTLDVQYPEMTYDTGQVHMGSTWNRYGTPGETLGYDWSLILAHELSHYLLFQEDTYLGLTDTGLLKIVDTCQGSAMGDVYAAQNTEFVSVPSYWAQHCGDTLAHKTLKRNEWETLKLWYPALKIPQDSMSGPSLMPFSLTDVEVQAPITPTLTLDDPTIIVNYQDGNVSSSEARAFLLRSDKYIIDLGSPSSSQNRVQARGAVSGDKLCVFDRLRSQYGCGLLESNDTQITLEENSAWTPTIKMTPVTSTTYDLDVTGLNPGLNLKARLFPEFGVGTQEVSLVYRENGYKGAFTDLVTPSSQGHIQVWVDEPTTSSNPRQEVIVAYSIGGNPGWARPGSGGWSRAGGGWARPGSGGWRRAGAAPLVSPDGQMTFFTPNPIDFKAGELFTIQGTAGLPPIPAGKIVVGQGYNLVASPGVSLPNGSISFQYLENNVRIAGLDETKLQIHYWDGKQWWALDTIHDQDYNFTSAPSRGPGMYALMHGSTTPSISSFTPQEATTSITTTFVITGSNFLPPVKVELLGYDSAKLLPIELALESFAATTITATVPAGLAPGPYAIRVTNGDGSERTNAGTFGLYPPDNNTCFSDWFGSGAGRWQLRGDWKIVTLPDGTQAMTDSPQSNYQSADPGSTRITSITSQAFDLAQCEHPVLTFRHDYRLAKVGNSKDVGNVEISRDNGATWEPLEMYSGGGIYGNAEQSSQAITSSEWSDVEWKPVQIDLSRYQGSVRLRFTLIIDEYVADRGRIIDDIAVRPGNEQYRLYFPFT